MNEYDYHLARVAREATEVMSRAGTPAVVDAADLADLILLADGKASWRAGRTPKRDRVEGAVRRAWDKRRENTDG